MIRPLPCPEVSHWLKGDGHDRRRDAQGSLGHAPCRWRVGHLVGDAVGVTYEFRARGSVGEVRWFIGMRGTEVVPLVDALMDRRD